MCNFKIGQEVVSLSSSEFMSAQYREKDEIVTVTRLSSCPSCGTVEVNVNNRPVTSSYFDFSVCECGERSPHFGFGWTPAKYFAPLQTDSEEADMNEALAEILERELFEVK